MKKIKFLILGAGPTGLGAGWRLKELKEKDFLILEKNSHVGGLAFTYKDEKGFLWDFGGHVLFSHYKYFDEMYEKVMKGDYHNHLRESYVVIDKNTWVPYPFQYNIHKLKKRKIYNILRTLLVNKYRSINPKNFYQWVLKNFGTGIANEFMHPYNFKVWAHPLKMMSYTWIGERVAQINIEKLLSAVILGKDNASWGPNNKFKFPKIGGNQGLWNNVSRYLKGKIVFDEEFIDLDTKNKILKTSKESYQYDFLISTIPINELIKNSDSPKSIKDTALELLHSSVHVVGVGLKQPINSNLKEKCWFYFPDKQSPFYRITIFSNYSPNNVPDINKYWSIMTEVSESKYKKIPKSNQLKKLVVEHLHRLGFIEDTNQINHVTHFSKEYAYPTPSISRDNILKVVQKYLMDNSIYSRGRFGGWKYEVGNQDHSFMQGVEVINNIKYKTPEVTYFNPEFINR